MSSATSTSELATLRTPELTALPVERLEAMLVAGEEALECERVLKKAGLNIVGEILRGQGEFYEYNHYPNDDVYDRDSHAQYYYHAHRGIPGEHGHFHTFLRRAGMPEGVTPAPHPEAPAGEAAIAHLIAISMDAYGWPIGLFATNRWVAGDTWYPAEDVIRMIDLFAIDHAYPSWPVNRWISAIVRLFRPQIEVLLRERDRVVADWRERHAGVDVFEDRRLEVTGYRLISVATQLHNVRAASSG
jgi:Domain of unknown function (DUF6969)